LTVNAREPYIIQGQTGYYYHQDTIDFTVNTHPTPTPTLSPTPTPIPTPTPTLSPTQQPTIEPTPTPPLDSWTSEWIPIAIVAVVVVLGVSVLIYIRKPKK